MSETSRLRALVDFTRPFTLIAPALGVASAAATAIGAHPREPWSWSLLAAPAIGTVMAAVLNAASNGLNQIYDLDIDRLNKPKRPLPSGRLSMGEAWAVTLAGFALAFVLAWFVAPGGRRECFWMVVAAAVINSFRKLAGKPAASIKTLQDEHLVEYIPFPESLKGKYQSFTQADMTALRRAGYKKDFLTVEEGVGRYISRLAEKEGISRKT